MWPVPTGPGPVSALPVCGLHHMVLWERPLLSLHGHQRAEAGSRGAPAHLLGAIPSPPLSLTSLSPQPSLRPPSPGRRSVPRHSLGSVVVVWTGLQASAPPLRYVVKSHF